MKQLIAIAFIGLGGGLGSVARYGLAVAATRYTPVDFPLGTLAANLLGSLCIGILWGYFDRVHISHEFRLFLFTGFLGGFTTFSSFAREAVQLARAGEGGTALAYVLLTNFLGLALVVLGFFLCQRLSRPWL